MSAEAPGIGASTGLHAAPPERRLTLWLGAGLALVTVFIRCTVALYPLPAWDTDPLELAPVPSGFGPFESILLDVLSVLALGVVLAGRSASRASMGLLALWLVGLIGVVYHGWIRSGPDLENIRLGLSWASAWAGGLALYFACRDRRIRLFAGAALVGLIGVLAARGALQYFIEHEETVRTFRETRDQFFASKGWEPDSQLALSYERRLNQPEATGWFGLSNVYASLAAGAFVAMLAWTVESVRAWRRDPEAVTSGWVGLLGVGAVISAIALVLSGSRGGWGVAVIGAAVYVAWRFVPRSSSGTLRTGLTVLPIALVLSAPVVIALHGQLGDNALDLSLRFRWFYIRTAAAIFGEHPIAGVGPADFQDAYMLHKPAISPESVSSPHSYLFDLASTLGLAGLAWVAIALTMLWRLGAALLGALHGARQGPEEVTQPTLCRADFWLLLALTAVPTLISAFYELNETTFDRALARLLGLGIWFGLALGAVFLMRASPAARIAPAFAALTVALHAQIEVTGTAFGAAHWLIALLCVAASSGIGSGVGSGIGSWAGPGPDESRKPARIRSRAGRFVGVIPAVLVVGIAVAAAWAALLPAGAWQSSLLRGAEAVAPVTELRQRIAAVSGGGGSRLGQRDSFERIAADLAAATGLPRPETREEFEAAAIQLQITQTDAAMKELTAALAVFPSHEGVTAATSRLALQRADLLRFTGRDEAAADQARLALTLAERSTKLNPRSPGAWARLGGVLSALAGAEAPLGDDLHGRVIRAYERAAGLDPQGLVAPVRLAHLHAGAGDRAEAARWAGKALEIDENLRLDPLVRLSEAQRKELVSLLGNP